MYEAEKMVNESVQSARRASLVEKAAARGNAFLAGADAASASLNQAQTKPAPEFAGLVLHARSQGERVIELLHAVERLERAVRGPDSVPEAFDIPLPIDAKCVADEVMFANSWITWLTSRIDQVTSCVTLG